MPLLTFKLIPKSSLKVRILYKIPLSELANTESTIPSLPVKLYFYNSQSYYIQFVLKFKLSNELRNMVMNFTSKKDNEHETGGFFLSKLWNIPLNILAVVFICATIIKFREDEKQAEQSMMRRSTSELFSSQYNNGNIRSAPSNYQKAIKRMRLKSEYINQ